MELDIDALVGPVSDEEPAGPDLYGDIDRQTIEQAFERAVSADGATGADVDWPDIIKRITGQGEKTRDLWLPVYLMRAAAKAGRITLVFESAQWLARLVEERWDDVHPQLDEVGFIGRKTPCESLTRIGEFLAPLGLVPLLTHARLGSFNGKDLQRFADEGSSADGYGMFRAVLEETSQDDLRELVDGFDALTDAIRRTDTVLTEKAEGDTATNFSPTYDALRAIREALAEHVQQEEAEPPGETAAGQTSSGSGASPAVQAYDDGGAAYSGSIASRRDVERALDAICDYYARHEPGSPVPFALRRAKEWISLDFFKVLEDIAPGSISEASQVLKSQMSGAGSADSVNSDSVSSDSVSSDNGSDSSSDDSWGSDSNDSWGSDSDDSWGSSE